MYRVGIQVTFLDKTRITLGNNITENAMLIFRRHLVTHSNSRITVNPCPLSELKFYHVNSKHDLSVIVIGMCVPTFIFPIIGSHFTRVLKPEL